MYTLKSSYQVISYPVHIILPSPSAADGIRWGSVGDPLGDPLGIALGCPAQQDVLRLQVPMDDVLASGNPYVVMGGSRFRCRWMLDYPAW